MYHKNISVWIIFILFITGKVNAGGFSEDFSISGQENAIPVGWKVFTFRKIKEYTEYSVINNGKNSFLKAKSSHSASAIYKELSINPKENQVLTWRWKADNILKNGDAKKKEGDDYPARIYINFEYNPSHASLWEKAKYGIIKKLYGKYPPGTVISYIWANKLPRGTVINNVYAGERTKMVAVESGTDSLREWKTEQRNVYEDYISFFGREPPQIIGIAIMTDSDNTKESATAYYDDILLK